MKQAPLGHTELQVSRLGLGCVTFGREIERAVAWAILDRAAEVGITLLDTAEVYGEGASETIIGQWIAAQSPASRPTVATKVHLPLTADHLELAVAQSLRRLGVDRLDLLQLHSWDTDTPPQVTCAALASLQDRQLVEHVGCSNFSASQLRQVLAIQTREGWPAMASIQPRYNLVSRQIESELLPTCVDQGVGVLSYSPLGAGFLTGKYRSGTAMPTGSRFDIAPGHRDLYFSPLSFQIAERVAGLAEQHGVPVVELALAWVLRRSAVTCTLIGARRVEHVEQALRALRLELEPSVWSQLDAVSAASITAKDPRLV